MEVQGKLLEISDTVQVKETFRKREFVLEYADNPQYPEYVKFECIQDRCDQLDNFSVGQDVMVSFNLKGRKWVDPQGTTKYFNSLQAWRIQPHETTSEASVAMPTTDSASSSTNPGSPRPDPMISAGEGEEDDLPF